MADWDKIIQDPAFRDLPPSGQLEIRRSWFDSTVLPELRAAKIPEDAINEERNNALREFDNGQGYVSSALNSAAQGFLRTGTTALQGVGAIVGSDALEDTARDLDESVTDTFSNNPSMTKTNFTANALGNAASFMAGLGAGGVAAKGLGLAARTGAQVGGLGLGGLAGFGGGVQQADQYGITGGDRYLRGVAGAAVEVGSELILPGGLDAELGALGRVTGLRDLVTSPTTRFGAVRHAVLTEGIEEGIAQVGGNAATQILQRPGGPAPTLTEGLDEAMLGGAIGGSVFGMVTPVRKSDTVAAAAEEAAVMNNDPVAAEIIANARAATATRTVPVAEPTVEALPEGDITLGDLITPVEADRTPLTSEDLPDIEGLSTDPVPETPPVVAEVVPETPQVIADETTPVNEVAPVTPEVVPEVAPEPLPVTTEEVAPQPAPEVVPISPEDFAEEPVLTPEQLEVQQEYERRLIDTEGRIPEEEAIKVFDALKALGATNADLVINDTGWLWDTGPTTSFRGSNAIVGGKETVFLNRNLMTSDTTLHEVGHGFIPEMETSNPDLYAQGQALVEGSAKDLMEAIRQRYARHGRDLAGRELLHETLTTLNGIENGEFWRRYVRDPVVVQKIQQWIARVREWVGRHLGSKGVDPNMSIAEFAKRVNRRILAGRMVAAPSPSPQLSINDGVSDIAWRLRPAFDRLVQRTGSDSVFISDLVRESGLPLSQVQEWLREYGIRQGQATLDTGDWSTATEEQRAANVMLRGQERLYVQMHPGVGTGPAPVPTAAPVQQRTQAPTQPQTALSSATLRERNPALWEEGASRLTRADYTDDLDQAIDALVGPNRVAWAKNNVNPSRQPATQVKQLLAWADKARAWGEQNRPQFSINDDAYMAAVESGDVETQQAMVDEAAVQFIESFPVSANTNDVPNTSSIRSSLDDYQTFGVRDVPTSLFGGAGKKAFYAQNDRDRVDRLAEAIGRDGLESPLIVVVDGDPNGPVYVLEGAHRLAAVEELGLKTVPALVVYDESAAPSVENDRGVVPLSERFPVPRPQFSIDDTPVRRRSGVARNQPGSLVREITQGLFYNTQTNKDAFVQAAELYEDNAGFTFEQHLKELQDLYTVKGQDYLNGTFAAYFGLVSRDISNYMNDPSLSESEREQARGELTQLYQVVKEAAAAGGQFVQSLDQGLKIANNPQMEVAMWESGLPFDQNPRLQKQFEDERKIVTRELDEMAAEAVKNTDPDDARATAERNVGAVIQGEAASDEGAAVLDGILGPEADAVEAGSDLPEWFRTGVSGLNDKIQADIDEWLALLEARSILMARGSEASMTSAERSALARKILGDMTGKSTAEQLAEIDKQIAVKLKGFRRKTTIPTAAKPASEDDLKGMVVGRLERHLNRLLNAPAKKAPQITQQKIAEAISTSLLSKAGYAGIPVTGDLTTALGLLLANQEVAASAVQEIHTLLENDPDTAGAITREKLKAFMQLSIGKTFDTSEGASKDAAPYGEKQVADVLRAELRRADLNMTKIVKDAAMARMAGPALEAQLRDPKRGFEKLLGEKGLNDLVNTVLGEFNKTAAQRADALRRAEGERVVRQRMRDDLQAAERFEKEKMDAERKIRDEAEKRVREAMNAEKQAMDRWEREQNAAAKRVREDAERTVRDAMEAERKAAERWEREQAASAERVRRAAEKQVRDAMAAEQKSAERWEREQRQAFVRRRQGERRLRRMAGLDPEALNEDETKKLMAVPGEKIIDYLARNFGFDLNTVTSIARMEDRTRTVKDMTLKLADNLGLSTAQAEKFSQDVVAQAMKTVDQKRKKEVERKISDAVKTMTGRRMKSKGPLTEAQRLIRLAEMGGLTAENIEQVMLKNINAKKFTPEFRTELEELLEKANDPNLPATSRSLYYSQFIAKIQSARGVSAIGLWGEFLMSNIFFSFNTFKVNYLFGGMKALADSGVMILNTSGYVGRTEDGQRAKGLSRALAQRYLRAYAPVFQYHAKYILSTGRSMLTDDVSTHFSASNMELLANLPYTEIRAWMDGKPVSKLWRPVFKGMGYFNKFVRRIMVSTDIYHRTPAVELLKQRAVAKALVAKGGRIPSSSAEWNRVLDEAMYGMPWQDAVKEANRIADDAVATGKVPKAERGIFFGETLDNMMSDTLGIDPKLLNNQMQEEGKRVTAANPVEGIFGALSNVLVNMSKNIPGFSFQMPAIRTPINFFTQSLDWTPWGFMRAWAVDWNNGKSTSVTNALFNRNGRFTQWNLPDAGAPEGAVAEFRIKATIGTTAMLLLGMALKADLDEDDDKAFFYITGKGPEDPMVNRLWREKGFRPFAMRIGGKWLAYQEMPGFAAFAWLGAVSDTYRYGKDSESNTEKMAYAFQRTVGSFGDAAVLKSLQTTVGAVTGNTQGASSSLEKGQQTAGNIASLALAPRIGKEVNDILFGKQDVKAGGWSARIFANIPFVPALINKPALNFFGEEIHQVRGGPMGELMPLVFHRVSLVEKDDPQMRFMANMGANYISTPRRFKDGRKVMEDYDFVRDWSKKSGVELRKWLTPQKMEYYTRKMKIDREDAEADFDADLRRIRTRVLRKYPQVQF